jgi:hypothetical protein
LQGLRLAILRPSSQRISGRILPVLQKMGYDVEKALVVPAKTSDAEMVRVLAGSPRPRALLFPYHLQRDVGGAETDALSALIKLRQEIVGFDRVTAIMPVSLFGRASFELQLETMGLKSLPHHVVVFEDELDDPKALQVRLRASGV